MLCGDILMINQELLRTFECFTCGRKSKQSGHRDGSSLIGGGNGDDDGDTAAECRASTTDAMLAVLG